MITNRTSLFVIESRAGEKDDVVAFEQPVYILEAVQQTVGVFQYDAVHFPRQQIPRRDDG